MHINFGFGSSTTRKYCLKSTQLSTESITSLGASAAGHIGGPMRPWALSSSMEPSSPLHPPAQCTSFTTSEVGFMHRGMSSRFRNSPVSMHESYSIGQRLGPRVHETRPRAAI